MKLFEFQSKEWLRDNGFTTPRPVVVDAQTPLGEYTFPSVVKAQVLKGNRKRDGLIQQLRSREELQQFMAKHQQKARFYLLEEYIDHYQEYFISVSYDHLRRNPLLLFSDQGGMEIERGGIPVSLQLNPRETSLEYLKQFFHNLHQPHPALLASFADRLISFFMENDLLLCEINPFVVVNNEMIILDAKIEIDDNSAFRHKEIFSRYDTQAYQLTDRERSARLIDADDHRGVAGKSYLDLDGDIAILASGGGASLVALDILIDSGGRPANYVEYSGNPPREKVKQLTRITLSRDQLAGCWIVGGVANFTDIHETLQGIGEAILERNPLPQYPIVIRRAGPNDDKAKAYIEELKAKYHLDIHFCDEQTSICQSAEEMIQRSREFKEKTPLWPSS